MSFLNALPLPILVLSGFAVLGFCNYWKKLRTWGAKINMFSNYRSVLAEFHNNVMEGKDINPELSDYLLENAPKINLDSIIHISTRDPLSISTGAVPVINDIVTFQCYDFTETCQTFQNMLTQNIGFFKDQCQVTRSKIINPIHLVKNGVSLIFNSIPVVNLIPTKFKNFLFNLFIVISVVETLLSLFSLKSLLLSIGEQIMTWVHQGIL